MKRPYILCLQCVLLLYSNVIMGQEGIKDTLLSKNYEELKSLFYDWVPRDNAVAKTIAETYIEKGRTERDSVRMARGYYYYAGEFDPEKRLQYADTIIALTENSGDRSYPAAGYLMKGKWYYDKNDYEKALKSYVKAGQYASKNNNLLQQSCVRLMIAALKSRTGDHEGALIIQKEHLYALENDQKYKRRYSDDPEHGDVYQEELRVAVYNLAMCYMHLKEIDSSKKYFHRGIEESLKYRDTVEYYKLVSGSGSTEYYAGNYFAALDSLDKALPHLNGKHNIAMAYYYKGQSHSVLQQHEKAQAMFLRLDSIAGEINYKFPELRHAYEYFVDHYRREQQPDSQLVYINKILKLDEELLRVRAMDGEISRRYDTPHLLRQKEKVISDLEQKQSSYIKYKYIILGMVMLLGAGLIHYYGQQQIYRKRFRQLLLRENKENELLEEIHREDKEDPGMPRETFRQIETGLVNFEKERHFTNPDVTLHGLSRELRTNSTYLSKVINSTRGVNFSQYLNGLRINHIVYRLQQEERLRSYSVHALAREAGYRTAQSFTNAFYKQTGIYPSYFIHRLNSIKEISS